MANGRFPGLRLRTYSQTALSGSNSDFPDYAELPTAFPLRKDCLVGLEAVRRAGNVIRPLQPEVSPDEITTVSKEDTSPVTVADFAAQAVTLSHIKKVFQRDSFIAEESSEALKEDGELGLQVLDASRFEDLDSLYVSVDLGKEYEKWNLLSNPRPSRVWALDPIDGTKGFLRGRHSGGQYAIALALLVDGVPKAAVLGCPNLPASSFNDTYKWAAEETMDNNHRTRGCIFVAVAGPNGGCYQLPFHPNGAPVIGPLRVTANEDPGRVPKGRFCLGVEKFSDPLGQCDRMANIIQHNSLHTETGEIKARRIDSQCKYGVLARAGAEYYARLPKPGYVEWIWDHAAGKVVIEAAGGCMTDVYGNDIDFSLGAQMDVSVKGVLASSGGVYHEALVRAFKIQESG